MKVHHLTQLKTLLGDAMELMWVTPSTTQVGRSGTTSVKDLDLAVRFYVPKAAHACDSNAAPGSTPPRGRSATRYVCSVQEGRTSPSSSSHLSHTPTTPRVMCSPSMTPLPSPGGSLHRTSNSALRTFLFSRIAAHIAASNPQFSGHTSLADILNSPDWDASADLHLQEAPLPSRPFSVPATMSSSLRATPVRACHSASRSCTPSHSIRRSQRQVSAPILPSPHDTPQSLRQPILPSLSPPATGRLCVSAIDSDALEQTTPVRVKVEVMPEQKSDLPIAPVLQTPQAVNKVVEFASPTVKTARRLTFLQPEVPLSETCTPQKAPKGRTKPCNVSAQKGQPPTPCQTPGKRKRTDPTFPVVGVSPPPCLRNIPRTPLTPNVYHTPRKTPSVYTSPSGASVGSIFQTPSISKDSKSLTSSCLSASPAARKKLLALSQHSNAMFADRLPVICVRSPSQSPFKTPAKALRKGQHDVHGPLANCATKTTPGSVQSSRSMLTRSAWCKSPGAKRSIAFPASRNEDEPGANAVAFYSSPSKISKAAVSTAPVHSILKKKAQIKCAPPEGSRLGNDDAHAAIPDTDDESAGDGNNVHSVLHDTSRRLPGAGDAAWLAASIMDDDMMSLLTKNQKAAKVASFELDPLQIRKKTEEV
jgi:hypothetical protein